MGQHAAGGTGEKAEITAASPCGISACDKWIVELGRPLAALRKGAFEPPQEFRDQSIAVLPEVA